MPKLYLYQFEHKETTFSIYESSEKDARAKMLRWFKIENPKLLERLPW